MTLSVTSNCAVQTILCFLQNELFFFHHCFVTFCHLHSQSANGVITLTNWVHSVMRGRLRYTLKCSFITNHQFLLFFVCWLFLNEFYVFVFLYLCVWVGLCLFTIYFFLPLFSWCMFFSFLSPFSYSVLSCFSLLFLFGGM